MNSIARYVVVFDTGNAQVLGDIAPSLLEADGYSTKLYFPRLGIAIVETPSTDFTSLRQRCGQQKVPIAIRPEQSYHASPAVASFTDTTEWTWGLQAVQADVSELTGTGIRLAVLDTGFHAAHPDFAGRAITMASFIDGEDPTDGHGHGTHCIGTACGPRQRDDGRGYGVAPGVEIFSGKVLGSNGQGTDTSILAGIDWALQHGCQVISMSLGADIREVHPPYVAAGRRTLEQGSLIIAAAGNNAARGIGNPGFVGAPANSPYVMAVGAVDRNSQVADFSARAVPEEGGEVNIAAPGVGIYSAWVSPQLHNTISGTSMATPHVSGIAALIAEATGARGQALWDAVIDSVSPLELPQEDIGAGLAVAPAERKVSPQPDLSQDLGWVITLDDQCAGNLEVVAAELRKAGVTVTKTLPNIGMLYASTAASMRREDLIRISGVASADNNYHHQINPPEAEVQ